MKYYTDLHIHSKYSRACSPLLTPENIALWCDKKGIGIVGTGDFTHPKWLNELAEALEEAEPGLYRTKDHKTNVRFVYTAEVASIYKQGDKVRRVHNLIFAPNREAAEKFNASLLARGANLSSDGRPIMGIHCDELVKIAKEADERMEVVPAHAWTPHFGVFGSLSGFNSLEEAYGNQAKHIFAIETGLSSDPIMNWQVEALDNITLISNSDPHSLHRLGREANCLEINPEKLSYSEMIRIIKDKNPKEFLYTVEFFPEEGRYHADGHADCKFSCTPQETKKLGGLCPKCGKKLLRGVLARIADLGNRSENFRPKGAIDFKSTIPLEEIIADCLGVGVQSKKVQTKYEEVLLKASEFSILFELSEQELINLVGKDIATAVLLVRAGKVHKQAGYDGEYGKIKIFENDDRELVLQKLHQNPLF
jgi:uncharacterized protein (TIGR00375 family)